jgi:hypothetical protein
MRSSDLKLSSSIPAEATTVNFVPNKEPAAPPPVPPSAPHEHTDEKPDQQLALLGKAKKKKNRRAKVVSLRPAPAV